MQEKSDRPLPERTLEIRKVAELTLHPQHSVFADPTAAEIELLAASINDRGLQHPLDILPDGVIIGGQKRWRALDLNGAEECECWVHHDLAAQGEPAIVQYLVYDNIERHQHSPLDVARAYDLVKSTYVRALDGDPRDMRDVIAGQFPYSGGTLDRLSRILRAPRIVQDAFDRGELRQVDAARVGRLPPSVQDEIACAIAAEMAYEIEDRVTPQEVVDRYLRPKQESLIEAPASLSFSPAEQARRDLITATGALLKAHNSGDKLDPDRRVSVSHVLRRLSTYLRQQA